MLCTAQSHAIERGCDEVIVARAIAELGEQLLDGQDAGMSRALRSIAHKDLGRTAAVLLKLSVGPRAGPLKVETDGEFASAGLVNG